MTEYPEIQQALPHNLVVPTNTARLLSPWIVLAALCVLCASSGVAFSAAGVAFANAGINTGVCVPTAGLVVAVCCSENDKSGKRTLTIEKGVCSMVYVALHLTAAASNEAIGLVRPPVRRLHAICFLVARLGLLLWILALVLGSIFFVKMPPASNFRALQLVAIVASGLGLYTSLSHLENPG
jgi:cadmium resistance protein CadD (predicted permease)